MTAWTRQFVRVSAGNVIENRMGWTYRGIGLVGETSRLGWWYIVHLNSGHAVARIRGGTEAQLKDMAADIADAGDWSFEGLDGFRNMFPDAADRVHEIVTRHRPELKRRKSPGPNPVHAKAIALLREDEERAECAPPADG